MHASMRLGTGMRLRACRHSGGHTHLMLVLTHKDPQKLRLCLHKRPSTAAGQLSQGAASWRHNDG
eukprot:1156625-Pelagomonas_calceolata.AAC.11